MRNSTVVNTFKDISLIIAHISNTHTVPHASHPSYMYVTPHLRHTPANVIPAPSPSRTSLVILMNCTAASPYSRLLFSASQ